MHSLDFHHEKGQAGFLRRADRGRCLALRDRGLKTCASGYAYASDDLGGVLHRCCERIYMLALPFWDVFIISR